MYNLYVSLRSSHQFLSHWSDELSLLQVSLLLVSQLINWTSWSDSLIRWNIDACDDCDVQCHHYVREIRVVFDDELRFRFFWINILSNSMLLDQLLKLFYSQMIIFWDQHDHEEIRNLFVHDDVMIWFYMKLFSKVFVWDLFNRSTSDEFDSILRDELLLDQNFLMKTCYDRLSLIYWLMLLLNESSIDLLASDVSGS
jgi:hypothetical protein